MNKVNQRTGKKKEGTGKVWAMILCLLLAGGIFAFLLNMEVKELSKYDKGYVVIAAKSLMGNTEITQENMAELFQIVERPLTDIPEAAYLDINTFAGQYVKHDIDAGSMITESMIGELTEGYAGQVLLGINMGSLEQSVTGTLRAGDKIAIYTVETVENEEVLVEKVLGEVTIVRSYTGSGTAILKEDENAIAQHIIIPVHKEAVGVFYAALENKKIEIVKHPE